METKQHSKTENSEEFRLARVLRNWSCNRWVAVCIRKCRDDKTGDLQVLMATLLLVLILVNASDDLARETDWSKPDRPKIEGTTRKTKANFLAWVATSAARARHGSAVY